MGRLEWMSPLIKSLSKLWEMYIEVKDGRLRDALSNVETRSKFTAEIEKLHHDLRNAQMSLSKWLRKSR